MYLLTCKWSVLAAGQVADSKSTCNESSHWMANLLTVKSSHWRVNSGVVNAPTATLACCLVKPELLGNFSSILKLPISVAGRFLYLWRRYYNPTLLGTISTTVFLSLANCFHRQCNTHMYTWLCAIILVESSTCTVIGPSWPVQLVLLLGAIGKCSYCNWLVFCIIQYYQQNCLHVLRNYFSMWKHYQSRQLVDAPT